jgi:MoxR-like ATPase
MNDQAAWDQVNQSIAELKKEIGEVIVGQEAIVEHMLTSLFCNGHCLLIGVPGLAKTLLVSTLGKCLGLDFRRIQFTPDMMPTDIIGSEILQVSGTEGRRDFEFIKGPVFANLILADEINRTPPKTQAALLEAMQEKQVTVSGKTRPLDLPFVVFATQNPIEQEGTYPLPEAQLDRFFFSLVIGYPTPEEEKQIVVSTTRHTLKAAREIFDHERLTAVQNAAIDIPLPDHVLDVIINLVNATRPDSAQADDYIRKYVAWGAGPRASQTFARAVKALALLRGNPTASVAEVKEVALPILRHRVIPNYNATGEGIKVDDIIQHLVDKL